MENQKKFGVWMNSHQAVVVGSNSIDNNLLKVIAHVDAEKTDSNSNEKNSNNHSKSAQLKFFKEIGSHMVNATHIHITGTGQVQEQFMHYLADTPQFKNSKTEESTVVQMSDERLIDFFEPVLK